MRWKFPLELTPEVRGCFISGVKEMGIDIKGDEIVREDSSELFKEYLDLPDYRKKFTAEQLMNYQLAKCAKLTD